MIPSEALSECLAVIGRTGAGKSYTTRGFVERVLDEHGRVCILDPTGVWWGLRLARDGRTPSPYPVVIFGGERADVPINDQAGAVVARIVAEHRTPCVVDVSELTHGGRTRFATEFFDTLYRSNRRDPLTLVVDEADVFAPQRPMPDQNVMFSRMEQIVRRGRVRGFRPWLITQRPAELHKSVLSQAGTLIALKLTAPQDRRAIEDWVKGHADKDQGAEVLNSLAGLPRGEGWVWYPAGDVLARQKFPAIRTFDSMRTPEAGEVEVTLAPLDRARIAEISGQIETLAEQAKADDPKRLKAEIARLTRELAGAKAGTGASAAEVEAARQEGYRQGRADGERDTMKFALATINPAAAAIENANAAMQAAEKALEAWRPAEQPKPKPTAKYSEIYSAPQQIRRVAPRPATNGSGKVHGDLSRPQQRILDALAWLESVGIDQADRVRAAMLADQSPRSSGYEKNISTLSTAGLISYPSPGFVRLTDAGRRAANHPARAPSTADLHEAIRSKVSGPQWRLLDALIRVYPRTLTREKAAEASDQSPASSGYEKNVSTLKSLGFIDYPERGQLVAAPVLFLEGR